MNRSKHSREEGSSGRDSNRGSSRSFSRAPSGSGAESHHSESSLKVLWFDDDASLPESVLERIIDICGEFEDKWHVGENPRIEDYLAKANEAERTERLVALLAVELELRTRSGQKPGLDEYQARFPNDAGRVRTVFSRARGDGSLSRVDDSFSNVPGRQDSQDSSCPRTEGAEEGQAKIIRDPQSPQGASPAVGRTSGEGWGEDEVSARSASDPDAPFVDNRWKESAHADTDDQERHDVPTMSEPGQAKAPNDPNVDELTFVVNEIVLQDAITAPPGGAVRGDGFIAHVPVAMPIAPEALRPTERGEARKHGPPPRRTGRYTLVRLIDSGMFGDVYLATDDVLHRKVALKCPRIGVSVASAKVDAFLVEARSAARLSHPGIVTVLDVVQRKDADEIFVVMEYIEGTTLRDLARTQSFTPERIASLLAAVADATHYAHTEKFIHRDLKPSNLLVDKNGMPHIVDFGLAVDETMLKEHAGELAGTIPYMAPEQIRGATHQIDRRTDIWALGIILYEMLTGVRPFPSDRMKAYNAILYHSPKPLREIKPEIPAELERIALKCLSKRKGERYATAEELSSDLKRWLAGRDPNAWGSGSGWSSAWNLTTTTSSGSGEIPSANSSVWSRAARAGPKHARIVPKGLRSFSLEDATYFLDLMPGPRDRDGLPESARFWMTRIDSMDRDTAFSVGLINGPSGCGKSSLAQAGILPRLAPHVLKISLSVMRDGCEAELLKRLRRHCPGLPASLGLAESVRALREGIGLPPGKKLLIVLDQFEQWLQAHGDRDDAPLVEALRQCDGARVQALLLVRDDFWTAIKRLFENLEIPLFTERNMAAVDLFDRRHALAVLAAFGRAYSVLPDDPDAIESEQLAFLERAVDGLAEGGRVIGVRLALFAEMVKDRPWVPATLEEIGGMNGVGITFLENVIGGRAQHPVLRPNRAAAIAVLEALLPTSGVQIKNRVRSASELIEASGIADRPKDFEAILRALDSELRLITPTEPDNGTDAPAPGQPSGDRGPYYQLTHDYLVPSIREWLERRKRETSRGRAWMRLELLTTVWEERPESRNLPSFLEWLLIRRHTRPSEWSQIERSMMNAANARLGWKILLGLLLVAGLCGIEMRHFRGYDADTRLEFAQLAKPEALPDALWRLRPYLPQLHSQLVRQAVDSKTPNDKRMVAVLALLDGGFLLPEGAASFFREFILAKSMTAHDLYFIQQQVRISIDRMKHDDPFWDESTALIAPLWLTVRDPSMPPGQILRAGAMLAGIAPDDPHWDSPELPTSPHPGATPARNVADVFNQAVQTLDHAGIADMDDWRSLLQIAPSLRKALRPAKP